MGAGIRIYSALVSFFAGALRRDVRYFVRLRGGKRYLVAEQVSDILQVVVDHRRTLQTESPRDDVDVIWEAHRAQHLWPEDT